uniref:Genetic suppressor element-like domain-containing protein n=1 Tax=Strigamia maritima TaxID=126957 RepID=T1J0M1_STRMM
MLHQQDIHIKKKKNPFSRRHVQKGDKKTPRYEEFQTRLRPKAKKKGKGEEKDNPREHGVGVATICFVCGSNGAEHYVHVKPRETGSSFPFLEHHVPPEGADVPSNEDGIARSCYLCYSFLNQQWDAYERTRTPHVKRLYWLKRTDNGPYMGAEMRLQGEYASQLMGLDGNGSTCDYKNIQSCGPIAAPHDENSGDAVLDLRSTKFESTLGPRMDLSTPAANQTEENDALDLSMPDKNSVTEVCYVCGEECSRGTLINIYAKPIANCPYFPSLTLHPRPSKSRPMDSTGRVQACAACHQHLLQQWDSYQRRNTPHSDRNYILRKRNQPDSSPSTPSEPVVFVCFTCGLEYPMTSRRVLQAFKSSNSDAGPFFSFWKNPPPGAARITAQGNVHVCSICYKSIHRQRHVFEISKTVEEKRVYRIQNSCTNGTIEWEGREIACYICNKLDSHRNTDILHTLPPKDPTIKTPYFPALQSLQKAIYASPIDEEGKIVTCKTCSNFLIGQWDAYEVDGVPQTQRHYRVRLTESASSTRKLSRELDAAVSESLHIQVSTPDVQMDLGSTHQSPLIKDGGSLLTTVSSSSLNHQQVKISSISLQHAQIPTSTASTRAMDLSTTTSARLVVRTNTYENQYYRPSLQMACVCYVCGHHSEQGKTYSLRAKPFKNRVGTGDERLSAVVQAAFFPFLSTHTPPTNADKLSGESGVSLVCIFCYHSLMAQWVAYEMSPHSSERIPWNRVYNHQNYVCYVCGVTTYRKRVRAVHVTDYPFLVDHPRPAGSLVLNGGDRVVVCLMCYHTLNLQWNDFERMKVPVELRKYNWISAPPPEDEHNRRHSSSSNGENTKNNQMVVIVDEENGRNDGVYYNQHSHSDSHIEKKKIHLLLVNGNT